MENLPGIFVWWSLCLINHFWPKKTGWINHFCVQFEIEERNNNCPWSSFSYFTDPSHYLCAVQKEIHFPHTQKIWFFTFMVGKMACHSHSVAFSVFVFKDMYECFDCLLLWLICLFVQCFMYYMFKIDHELL